MIMYHLCSIDKARYYNEARCLQSELSDGHNGAENAVSQRPLPSSMGGEVTSNRSRGPSATLSDFFFRRRRTTTGASDGDSLLHAEGPSTSSGSGAYSLPSTEVAAVSLSTGVIVGGRFSKSSDEREVILNERKRALIEMHRRSVYLLCFKGLFLCKLCKLTISANR